MKNVGKLVKGKDGGLDTWAIERFWNDNHTIIIYRCSNCKEIIVEEPASTLRLGILPHSINCNCGARETTKEILDILKIKIQHKERKIDELNIEKKDLEARLNRILKFYDSHFQEFQEKRKQVIKNLMDFYERLPSTTNVKTILIEFKSHCDELIDYIKDLEQVFTMLSKKDE